MKDVGHLHFLLHLLVAVDENSLLLLRPEVPAALETEAWAPNLYIGVGDATAVPVSFLRAPLFPIDDRIGMLNRHGLLIDLLRFWHHYACQVHEGASVLEHGHKEGKQRHYCSEQTSHFTQEVEEAPHKAFHHDSCLRDFERNCVPKLVGAVGNSSYLCILDVKSLLHNGVEICQTHRAVN